MPDTTGTRDLAALLKAPIGSVPSLPGPFGLGICGLFVWLLAGAFLLGAVAAVATAATNNPAESEYWFLEKSEFDFSRSYEILRFSE